MLLGKHITLVSHSRAMEAVMQGAKELAGQGIEAEVINLRTLRPLDMNTIIKSVIKTNHLITIEQGWPQCGIGAEIITRIIESEAFFHLDQPPLRLTGVDVPMPYAHALEDACIPRGPDVVSAVKKLLKVK